MPPVLGVFLRKRKENRLLLLRLMRLLSNHNVPPFNRITEDRLGMKLHCALCHSKVRHSDQSQFFGDRGGAAIEKPQRHGSVFPGSRSEAAAGRVPQSHAIARLWPQGSALIVASDSDSIDV